MYTKDQICEKICELYPDIGVCGINLDVDFDRINSHWVVSLKNDNKELKTFLDFEDTRQCMDNNLCKGLGLQISQIKDNLKKTKYY